jgi:hypothetical protein
VALEPCAVMVKKIGLGRWVIAMGDQQARDEWSAIEVVFPNHLFWQVDQLLIKLKRRQTPSKDLAILTAEALRKVGLDCVVFSLQHLAWPCIVQLITAMKGNNPQKMLEEIRAIGRFFPLLHLNACFSKTCGEIVVVVDLQKADCGVTLRTGCWKYRQKNFVYRSWRIRDFITGEQLSTLELSSVSYIISKAWIGVRLTKNEWK